MHNLISKVVDFKDIQYYIWILFFVAIVLLVAASMFLTRYANVLIKRTKLGAIFIGGVLISLATSLPELFTQIFQSNAGSPEVAISDDIGSNSFGVFLIGISSIFLFRYQFLRKIKPKSAMLLYISFIVSIIYSLVLFFGKDLIIGTENVYTIGLIPIFFWLVFIGTTIFQYFNKKDSRQSDDEVIVLDKKQNKMRIFVVLILFVVSTLFLLLFSLFLNVIVGVMSNKKVYNLGPNTVGGLFFAITTSLPEIVVFLVFLHKKQPTAAFGTIIGSQIFNFSLVFYGDLIYTKTSSIIKQSSTNTWHLGVLLAIMMSFLIIQIIFVNKMKIKGLYFVLPSLITITYISWWIYLIAINS